MAEENRSVIVTGASGFIGSHLIKRLLNSNFSVIAITRSKSSHINNTDSRIVWCEWQNIECLLQKHKQPPIAIIHLATAYGRELSDLLEVEDANVLKPLRLLELASKYKINKFINTDSYFAKSEFNYQYMRPYIITKNSFNEWGAFFSTRSDVKFINMRLEHVYGPGDGQGKFIPFLVYSFLTNKEKIECTDCSQKRDFIYVDDVVSAYMTILNADSLPMYAEYQVGLGYSVSMKVFIEALCHELPKFKGLIKYGALGQRENEIMDSYAENKNLKALGWEPEYELHFGVQKYLSVVNALTVV